METSKLISTTNITIYPDKDRTLSTNNSDLTKYRKVIPFESSIKKDTILNECNINIETEENIYYQGDKGIEVVPLYHKKYQEKKGNK